MKRRQHIGGVICDNIFSIKPEIFRTQKCIDNKYVKTNSFKGRDVDINKTNVIMEDQIIYHIQDSEILFLDIELLKKDFVFFNDKSDDFIKKYILDNCSIMSIKNYNNADKLYNEDIKKRSILVPTDKNKYYRPPNYGRSLVFDDINNKVQIDMKGVGANKYFVFDSNKYSSKEYEPEIVSHRTGCFPLGEAIEEYFNEHIFRNIVYHNTFIKKAKIDTLKSYGIIKLNITLKNEEKTPIAIYLRQAINRNIDLFNETNKLILSSILSIYGIGSHANGGNYLNINEYINVQGSDELEDIKNLDKITERIIYLIDFSGFYYYCKSNFEELIKQNLIIFLSIKIGDYYIQKLQKSSNIKELVTGFKKEENKQELIKLTKKYTSDEVIILDNKNSIYGYISRYILKFITDNVDKEPVKKTFIEIYQQLKSLSFWFTCNITDTTSLKDFCEKGNYDIDIRKKLLEEYGTVDKSDKLNKLICQITSEFNKYNVVCQETTIYDIQKFIKDMNDVDQTIKYILIDGIDRINSEIENKIESEKK